jgi:hypothetical protein
MPLGDHLVDRQQSTVRATLGRRLCRARLVRLAFDVRLRLFGRVANLSFADVFPDMSIVATRRYAIALALIGVFVLAHGDGKEHHACQSAPCASTRDVRAATRAVFVAPPLRKQLQLGARENAAACLLHLGKRPIAVASRQLDRATSIAHDRDGKA